METPESDLLNNLTLRDIHRELNKRILARCRDRREKGLCVRDACEHEAECDEATRRSGRMWREDFEAFLAANDGIDRKLKLAQLGQTIERKFKEGLQRDMESAAKRRSADLEAAPPAPPEKPREPAEPSAQNIAVAPEPRIKIPEKTPEEILKEMRRDPANWGKVRRAQDADDFLTAS